MAKIARLAMVITAVFLVVGVVSAQTSTIEIKQGTVVHVYGDNLIVRDIDGVVKEYDIPPNFQFMIDGEAVGISDLKPGTKLTAVVTTTTTPHVVQTAEVKNARVVKVVGGTVILRGEDGAVRKFTEVPEDATLTSNGKPVTLYDLKEGMNVTATIVHTGVTTVTETETGVAGHAPAKHPVPVKSKPAPAPSALPSTGSMLPLLGLVGLIVVLAAASLAVIRRFDSVLGERRLP